MSLGFACAISGGYVCEEPGCGEMMESGQVMIQIETHRNISCETSMTRYSCRNFDRCKSCRAIELLDLLYVLVASKKNGRALVDLLRHNLQGLQTAVKEQAPLMLLVCKAPGRGNDIVRMQ